MQKHAEFPVLETEKLVLKEITSDDAQQYFEHLRIPETVEGTVFLFSF
jgi:hypothetical protein